MRPAPEPIGGGTLQGAANFRAVLPYEAANGRRLRPGLIYRSGELSSLTRTDLDHIAASNIKLICDLRSRSEQIRFATQWPKLQAARTLTMPETDSQNAGIEILISALAKSPGPEGARVAMLKTYARMPETYAPLLRVLFSELQTGWGIPLLIHCHAGKDRTGFAVAMLLAALGVSQADILDDYARTNQFFDMAGETSIITKIIGRALGTNPDPATAKPLAAADPAYLASALAAIETRHGSIDAYLTTMLNLTPPARSRLHTLFLTTAQTI
ncbi:MAG TPA: tyrosine-protein phosphatase [Acetobacteraceae bacterium]|nr:tyrosine-protein phosphatase [Acetobacteraceae bacterium]